MADYTAYPSASNLQSYLNSLGLLTTAQVAALNLTDRIAAATDAWEEETGWHPFIKDTSDVSRQFTPPGPNRKPGLTGRGGGYVLDLDCGLLTVTSIVTGYSASPTSPSAGTTEVAEDDYWLLPEGAPLENRPYTQVEFAASIWGQARSIRITGKWGFCSTLPDDAFQAILRMGALQTADELVALRTGGMIEWEEEARERYGENPLGKYLERWQSDWDRAVMRYRRIVV
jgi:hypothetical protein